MYAAFYDEYVKLNAFLHSHSFTGNPLACAAALASLAIFREDRTLERNRALAEHLGARARELQDHPHVAEVRQRGMIVAVELAADKATRTPYPWQERRGLQHLPPRAQRAACCCGRSATWCTSCRRTWSPPRRST